MFFKAMTPGRAVAAALAALMAVAGPVGPAAAETGNAPGNADDGRALYMEYCVACHGPAAEGAGPMAGVLTIKPVDLTALAANDPDGRFPRGRVVRRIDGRDPLVSHGSPMPVYGFFFEGSDVTLRTDAGQPIMTSQPVADLVSFLETLQD
jgi:cytochrome c1